MKPTFALDLSRDVIALLHRTPKGWLTIGEASFDAPDLAEALDFMRKTALGLSPLGLASKVVLPNSQVLYTEIHAPGPSREDKRRQIAQALQGRTPYAVEDLVFDWSGKGTVVRVAVVARETLDEAEAFAEAHRLNPVSIVAIPEDGTFVGEAWFGPTNSADTFLAPGETVERDRDAVRILAAETPEPGQGSAAMAGPDADGADGIDTLPGLEEALSADVTEADLAAATALRAEMPADAPQFDDPIDSADFLDPVPQAGEAGADVVSDVAPAPETGNEGGTGTETDPSSEPADGTDLPSPDTLLRDAPAASADALISPATAVPLPAPTEPEEAPFADILDDLESAEAAQPALAQGQARVLAEDILDDDLPPAPSAAAMFAFSSRRSAAAAPQAGARPIPPVTATQPAGSIPRPSLPSALANGSSAARPATAAVTAPGIPGLRAKPKLKPGSSEIPRPIPPGPVTVKSPVRPSGTFGALPPPRGRSGFMFMLLIGLLLLSLALVAVWASFFLTQAASEASLADPVEVSAEPAVEDEMAADLQDPEEFAAEPAPEDLALTADPVTDEAADLAALAVEEKPVNIGGDDSGVEPTASVAETLEDAALPDAPAVGTEAAAAGTEAEAGEPPPGKVIATEVSGARTPVEDQDEIFLAAMDAPPPVLDAHALPVLATVADAPPDAAMPPPAFGTVYQFDANGLLMPTPEGILTPEGIMLFAGPPPLVPPARSAAAAEAAALLAPVAPEAGETAATETATAADGTTTAADASLVTAGDPAAEAPPEPVGSDPAMAGFRPMPRPEGLVVPDDGASLDTTADSDVASLRPLARPASVTAAAAAVAAPAEDVADLGAQGASLAAQAEARLAEAAALEAANPSIVAISMRPEPRPSDLSRAVEAAVAAAVREPDPSEGETELAAAAPDASSEETAELDEPETDGAAPSIPTKASVAKQATYENAISLSKTSLIGIFGTSSNPYALIRTQSGKYKKVEIGDKVDGGVVKAITENEVRYQKGGKLVSLKMPKA